MPEPTTRITREARPRWVPLNEMKVSPSAQRELNPHWVDKLAADMVLEDLGKPTVNQRDGHYYVIDGQHRVEALRKLGFTDEKLECETYVGLTEQEEADKFLVLNNKLTVATMDRFLVGVTADREAEREIDRLVREAGYGVGLASNAIGCVTTLRRIYQKAGPKGLARTLRIVGDAYGEVGLTQYPIHGVGLLCQRFNGQLDDELAVQKLGGLRGGVGGLMGKADVIRQRTRKPLADCVAAAAVEVINSGKGGKKLPNWWSA